ncbi:hypothetical protein M0812_00583 [Anaeramoeba flamelloides]|uniref:Homeobox domain-containing protein n=1 Tax=Anaeramoeba flamelloides TaxID=1746091 RepID=A0AAV8A2V8_9EUKA|nr:hypothetical protein M0812_00583 [Anaeramoeba flamelloides]
MYFLKANNEINEISKPIRNDQEDLNYYDTLIPYSNYPKPYDNYEECLSNKENNYLGFNFIDCNKEKDLSLNGRKSHSDLFGYEESLSELMYETDNHFTCHNIDDFDLEENSFEKESIFNLRQKKIMNPMSFQSGHENSQYLAINNLTLKKSIKTNFNQKQDFGNKLPHEKITPKNFAMNRYEMNYEDVLPLDLSCEWFSEDHIQNNNYPNLNEQLKKTNSILYQKKMIGATPAVNKEQMGQPREIKIEKKGLSNLSYNQKLCLDNIFENKISINNIFLSEPSIINFVSKKKSSQNRVNSLNSPNNRIDSISLPNDKLKSKVLNNLKPTQLTLKINHSKTNPQTDNFKHRNSLNMKKKIKKKKKNKTKKNNKNKNKKKKRKRKKKTKTITKKITKSVQRKEIKRKRKRKRLYPYTDQKPGKTTKKYKLKIGRAANQGGKGVSISAFEVPITIRCRTTQFAQNVFEKWFLDHCLTDLGPYPDQKTQTFLASEAKTSVLRVVRWFGQRRRIEKEKWENGKIEKPKWLRKKGKVKKFV